MDTFDVVVVGAGAVGENAADRAGRTGLSVALVERELVGGECSYWACMPSKALLRPGTVLADARAVPGFVGGRLEPAGTLARRDEIASHWHDDGQVAWARGVGLTVLRGDARLTGPRTLALRTADGEQQVTARRAVVLATGSVPVLPDVLAAVRPWTSREATSACAVPARLAVVGGGVVAVELADAFAALGAQVTVLVRGSRLLSRAEPFAGEALAAALTARGVDVRLGASVDTARRDADGVHLTVGVGGGRYRVDADEVLVATGRRPALDGLGLAAVGLAPDGPLQVDDAGQVAGVPDGWLFAAGDVTGRTATTHQGKYDARVVGDVIAARFGADDARRAAELDAPPWSRYRASADAAAVPQVVFTRPEVAWVGATLAGAQRAGLPVRAVDHDLGDLAGAAVLDPDYAGTARFVVDTQRSVLLGATFVGPGVGELLHAATLAVVGEVPLDRLWHAVPAYPTLSEVWLRFGEGYGL